MTLGGRVRSQKKQYDYRGAWQLSCTPPSHCQQQLKQQELVVTSGQKTGSKKRNTVVPPMADGQYEILFFILAHFIAFRLFPES